jgi:hypothetical protein
MRTHGVANFPDPSATGGISLPIGAATQSPSFQAASNACQKLLPGGGPGAHPISAADRRQLLANAQCMRTHGVPNFPDPSFTGGGIRVGFNKSIDPSSPAFQNAAKACRGLFGGKGRGLMFRVAP